ncbi:hypothetical protein CNMCM8980_004770 [Aspergillus fumigatiaffinis]|uniref:Pectinase D n=1 Tax=Aspergillus fumigatiaffinis TaxID=340414 RepID=A0A8H4H3G1_9EURO|nr:hypothetical protein CNMCM5878_002412 [Aspergillus fumigatiaffinis]KAF4234334.1 hypothetical protein CNMCM6457_004007 [Aspergillus fumigatiaffinis]KAF4242419.1 hypothetical protein CNMCM6805_002932 [Aspergillus fumigatiaffinis]KAF4248923.1 hypothetical protein CNMCM8980_004770 [Aspergillus fumigatiaffinis]
MLGLLSSYLPAWQSRRPYQATLCRATPVLVCMHACLLPQEQWPWTTAQTLIQAAVHLPHTYTEQVYIPRLKSNLTVQGYTCNAKSYKHNKVTITYNLALIKTTSDDLTATLRQWNPNTKIYNLNIFTNSAICNSQNGCRIKTNYNTTGYISNITYANIRVQNASVYGIDVQQDYLNGSPTGCPSNWVLIENVNFRNVVGTAASNASHYIILCETGSCRGFTFESVRITGGGVNSSCNYPASGCP